MSEIQVNTINEYTSANGVTIDGVKLKDSIVEVDTINESTSGSGVTIDSVLIKDGEVDGVDVSTLTSNPAFTIMDTFPLNGDLSSTGDITSYTAIANGNGAIHNIGSSITQSSGIFSFPETGVYKVEFWARIDYTYSSYINANIKATTNNSTYSTIAASPTQAGGNDDSMRQFPYVAVYVDVTDVSNVKVKFNTTGNYRTYTRVRGNGTVSESYVRFTKVADT